MSSIVQAKVSNIEDPEKRGRIKVECRAFLPEGTELDEWIEPMFPYTGKNDAGIFFVPDKGTQVELEYQDSDLADESPGQGFIRFPDFRWRCCLYSSTDDVPAEFRENYGKRMGWKTPEGSLFMFDDTDKSFLLKAAKVVVDSDDIKLGADADAELVRWPELKAYLESVTYTVTGSCPTGGGPLSGGVTVALGEGAVPSSMKTTKVKAK